MKINKKIISFVITTFVISLLILSGPAAAIDVSVDDLSDSLNVSDLDESGKAKLEDFDITIKVNDGEFLPVHHTNLIFSDGTNELTCTINSDNTNNCNFLTVNSRDISDLTEDYSYGYGYGYDMNDQQGNHQFGYGYGYGNPTGESGYGTITYKLSIDPSKLPGIFFGKEMNMEARVYGGTTDNYAYFKGSAQFKIISSEISNTVTPDSSTTITLGDIKLEIPKVPAGVSAITVQQIAPTTSPTSGYLTAVGKTYEFGPTGTVFTEPITITLTYTDEELSIAGITDESTIKAAYFDTTSNKWITIDTTVNAATNTITFTINHFTEFTVLSDSTPAQTSTTDSGQISSRYTNMGKDNNGVAPITETATTTGVTTPTETAKETVETTPETTENKAGMEGISGAAVTQGLLKTTLSKALAVIVLLAVIGFVSYYTIFRKRKNDF